MTLAVQIIAAWALMAGVVATAIAIGAAAHQDPDGVEGISGRSVAVLVLAVLLILQAIVWMSIGSGHGSVW